MDISIKVRDEKGIFLGVLMLPNRYADDLLNKRRVARVFRRGAVQSFYDLRDTMCEAMSLSFFLIQPAYSHPDSFWLHGIAPEEICAESGFAFLPSAEYMRRPVAEEAAAPVEPQVKPGPYLMAAREVSA